MKIYMVFCILCSIVLAIFMGIFFPQEIIKLSWIGQIYLNLLQLIVLPLVFCVLISATASIGDIKRLRSIGVLTIGYILFSMSIAVIVGLTLLNVFQPGVGVSKELILVNAALPSNSISIGFENFLVSLFPPNIFSAIAKYEIMPIVLFSIIFAVACISLRGQAKLILRLVTELRDVLVKLIIWHMYLTPFGLFSLLGVAIAKTSLKHLLQESMRGMTAFILIFLCGLIFQTIWQFLFVTILLRQKRNKFIRSAKEALLTAFATSSSMATLPVTLNVAKENGVNNDIASFVLPLTTTINLAGTAMYEAVSALFFCQVLGFHLSLTEQIEVFFTAILAGMGATGILEGGLVTMVMVLIVVRVPTSAIALLLPFDHILDRFRTVVNVFGDLVCVIFVDHVYKYLQNIKNTKLTEQLINKNNSLSPKIPIVTTMSANQNKDIFVHKKKSKRTNDEEINV